LSHQEIHTLLRPNRVKETIRKVIQSIRNKKRLEPRPYQKEIIQKTLSYFSIYAMGILVLMCGVGKTLISLWTTKQIGANKIIIGVPNRLLLVQWKKVVQFIFPYLPKLLVSDGVGSHQIKEFITQHPKRCIIITTYSSSHKVYGVIQKQEFMFDLKILDEVHHLTKNTKDKSNKEFIQILHIPSTKQLALTATMKYVEGSDSFVVSNDDVRYFGEVIDSRSLLWAISENIVCDYLIQTIIAEEDNLNEHLKKFKITQENDKRLFLSAYCSLKSIHQCHSHHLLIYANCKENAQKIVDYIQLLLEHRYFNFRSSVFVSNYNSNINPKVQKQIVNDFEKSKFGLISCVYCLGEGWDFPLLDGVVFAENMTSNIRILQSALRSGRKNQNEPNKKSKIILPILNKDDWLDETKNTDFKKVREVIYQMGLEDEMITHKIQVAKIKLNPKETNQEPEDNTVSDFCEYDEDLTQRLRLKTIKRSNLMMTYDQAKKSLARKNICSKQEYAELCSREQEFPTHPEKTFKDSFKNWIDYLGISKKFYDLETCKSKIKEYILLNPSIKVYHYDLTLVSYELCKLDPNFPPFDLWVEYYQLNNLNDIIAIGPPKRKNIDQWKNMI
jgi:superfamily II DNA or RNA helicase